MRNGVQQRLQVMKANRLGQRSIAMESLESRTVLSVTATLPTANLVNAAGFESGLGSWISTSGTGLSTTTAQAHSGTHAARASNRLQDWYGPRQTLQGPFTDGEQISVALWVKNENAAEANYDVMIRQADSAGVRFIYVTRDTATNTAWRELRGTFNLDIVGTLNSLELWVVGPSAGVNFFLDDVTVGRFDWRTAADARIDQLHKSNASIRIVDQFGNALQSATVEIRQTSQDYAFGSAINDNVLTNPAYADYARQAFNWVTLEYASTWDSNEFTRGVEYYTFADQLVAWANANGMQMRGHHLLWGQGGTSWMDSVPNSELQAEIEDRLAHALAHYAGDFGSWDVINESLHGTYFTDRLGDWITPWVYQRAHQLDPNVQLFVNEYQILEGYNSDDYVKHIQWIQSQGGHVDGIGVQAHLPGAVEPFTILSRLDELSSLGLPIWITEFDVASPDENIRADQLEMFYRLAYSHPDVDAVFLWDFFAGSPTRDPNRALMDVDGRINAAGQRLLALMDEWTTEVAATPVTAAPLSFRGFHGGYDAIVKFADGTQSVQQFTLDAANPNQTWTLVFPTYPKVSFASAPANDVAPGAIYSLHLSASNHAGVPATGTFTYQFDWNGDGVYEQSVSGPSNLSISHTYNTLGPQTIQVRVRDSRGAVSSVIQQSLAVTGFQLVTDAVNPSLTNLVWSGTFGVDSVLFTQLSPGSIQATVSRLDGALTDATYTFAGVTGRIIATALAGNDTLDASTLTSTAVEFHGGAGNDSIEGSRMRDQVFGDDGDDMILGDGNDDGVRGAADWIDGGGGNDTIQADGPEGGLASDDTILGGDGNDTIYSDGGEGGDDSILGGRGDDYIYAGGGNDFADGGQGDDILLGGDGGEGASDTLMGGEGRDILIGDGGETGDRKIAGADRLNGGAGEDILLAGFYVAPDSDALLQIRSEWASTRHYIERVTNIHGNGSGVRNNGNYFLKVGVNAFNDRAASTPASTTIADLVLGDSDLDWLLFDFTDDVMSDEAANEIALDIRVFSLPA